MRGEVELPGRLAAIAAERDRVWVAGQADPEGGVVYGIADDAVVQQVEVGTIPSALAVGLGAVWVANASGAGVLYQRHERRPEFPRENSVQRIDHATGEVIASIKIPNPTGLVVAHGSVWAVTPGGGGKDLTVVHRIDPVRSDVVARVQVPGCCPSIAATAEGIWLLTSPPPKTAGLLFIDPTSLAVSKRIRLPRGQTRMIAASDQTIWVLYSGGTGGLLQIRPMRADPVGQFIQLPFGQALTVDDELIWVSTDRPDVRLFREDGRELVSLGTDEPIRALTTDDGRVWAIAGRGTVIALAADCGMGCG